MRVGALVVGLIGSLWGIASAFTTAFLGGLGEAFEAEGASTVTGLGIAAVPVSIVGLIGAAISMAKPKVGGIMMIIAGVLGIILTSAMYIMPGALLLIGGVLALVGQKELKKKESL